MARGEGLLAYQIVEDIRQEALDSEWWVELQVAELLLSDLNRNLRYYDKAIESSEAGLKLARQIGMKEEVLCLLSEGKTRYAMGDNDEAARLFEEAKALSAQRNYDDHAADACTFLNKLI